jgi:N-acetylglucosamine-6-phosphate deacetylase
VLISAPRVVTGLDDPPGGNGPARQDGSPAVLAPGWVECQDGLIAAAGRGAPPRTPDRVLDGGVLVPGFVDLQVNGFFGVDLAGGDAEAWAMVARRLPETGTTAFLPTCITAPVKELAETLRQAAGFVPGLPFGARVLGVHLEGPFISPARAGAHRKEWIVPPSPEAGWPRYPPSLRRESWSALGTVMRPHGR